MPRRQGPVTKLELEIYQGCCLVLLLIIGIAIALIVATTVPIAGFVMLGIGLVVAVANAINPPSPKSKEISASKPASRAEYSKLRATPDFYRSKDWYEALDYPPEERKRVVQLRAEYVTKFKRDINR